LKICTGTACLKRPSFKELKKKKIGKKRKPKTRAKEVNGINEISHLSEIAGAKSSGN
jgi:hypothetical protein